MTTDKTLALVEKLHQQSILPKAYQVAKGQRLTGPVVVDLDPTTFCDLACPECISAGVLNKGQFDKGRVIELAKELILSGVQAVVLIGGGEPLMHKSIGAIIDILHQAGVKIGLVSNGTLIHRYLQPLSQKMDWVRISMDAGSQAVYDRYRPSGRKQSVFPKVIENMRLLAARKTGILGYSYLLMYRLNDDGTILDSNYSDVLNAARLAKDIGCDYFEVKAMYDDDHHVISPPQNLLNEFERVLPDLIALQDAHFRVLYSSTYDELKVPNHEEQHKNYEVCPIMELRTTVTPNGVFACPSHRGSSDGYLGDVSTQNFPTFWEQVQTTKVNPKEHCKFFCPRHDSNLEIIKMRTLDNPPAPIKDFNLFI
ncbi:radical SAM protein [Marinomonas agarivorans]|nr:radical SAM protein [Marinomonas agarivorans]